jgi:hypothetical protein
MAERRKRGSNGLPWYRADRDCWVTPGCPKKKPVRDRSGRIIRGEDSRDLAITAWQETQRLADVSKDADWAQVRVVLERYLRASEKPFPPEMVPTAIKLFKSFVELWVELNARIDRLDALVAELRSSERQRD